MKLLILGGTVFLGRHLVSSALDRGWDVTLFNRGRTNPELFPDLRRLTGDRVSDLSALSRGEWDAVIDTSGYTPKAVAAAASALSGRCKTYVFISTISVYQEFSQGTITEDAPKAELPETADTETLTHETYGALKYLCEQSVEGNFAGPVVNLRPGLIVGPYDSTWRFSYWVDRYRRGGPVLAPGSPQQPVQFVDARDLAELSLDMAAAPVIGPQNVVNPYPAMAFGDFLSICASCAGSQAETLWVSHDFLAEQGLKPFIDLPLWLGPDMYAMMQVSNKRAVGAGLGCRAAQDTVSSTLRWLIDNEISPQTGGRGMQGTGLSSEHEAEILNLWCNKSGS